MDSFNIISYSLTCNSKMRSLCHSYLNNTTSTIQIFLKYIVLVAITSKKTASNDHLAPRDWSEFLIAIQAIWISEGAFVTSLQAIGENQRHLHDVELKLILFAVDDAPCKTRELP